jgi:cytochrome c oxidase cbb3-type subunit 3
MNDPKEPLLLDHEADGIRELDNNLPLWWVWLFYLCIAYSFAYMGYYHVFKKGDLQAAEYEKDWREGEKLKAVAIAKFESAMGTMKPSEEKIVLGRGREIFINMCAPCHRPDGGGLVGPNLCDDYWIHGSNYVDNIKVILNGVPEKGMITWKGLLKPDEIQAVASYIYTLRGTKPVNPKPPENQVQPDKPNQYE